VNPYHLDIGDAQENSDDMGRKGRARRLGSNGENWGRKNGQAKLYPDEVREIRQLCSSDNGLSLAKIGRMYGVNGATVYDIHIRKIWRRLV
jgi:DNA invertase Pin-like site-specific DNA recombinase